MDEIADIRAIFAELRPGAEVLSVAKNPHWLILVMSTRGVVVEFHPRILSDVDGQPMSREGMLSELRRTLAMTPYY